MTNQLNKGTAKATGDLLTHLEAEYARMGTTIEYLRSLVGTNGNGLVSYPGIVHQKDPETIVAKARARFAATRRAAPLQRLSPEDWRATIVRVLGESDTPLLAREIRHAIHPKLKSNVIYGHLTQAVKAGAIRRQGGAYTLAGRPRQEPTAHTGSPRERSAAFLAQFDRVTPHRIVSKLTAPLLTSGYLAKKGDGYIRTGKPFNLASPPRGEKVKTQRARSAKVLAQFSATEPRPSKVPHGLGILVARGYLKRQGDGYVRTEKEFTV